MKKLIFTLIASLATLAVSAQTLSQGDQTITVSAALGEHTPIFVAYDNVVHSFAPEHLLSVGGQVGIANHYLPIAADASYHFVGLDKFDLYAGLRIGYNVNNYDSYFVHGIHLGSNYYVLPNLAIKLELGGLGYNSLALGVVFKL